MDIFLYCLIPEQEKEKVLKNILTEKENENWNAERRRNREEKLN